MIRLSLVLLFLSVPPCAAGVPAARLCSALPACRAHYLRALDLHRADQHRDALTAFQAAYDLSKEPRLLIDIGRSFHKLGRYREALASYERYQHLPQAVAPHDDYVQDRLPRFVAEARALSLAVTPTPAPRIQVAVHPEVKVPELHVKVDLAMPPLPPPESALPRDVRAPWYRRGWVWASIGGVVATSVGIGVGVVAYQQMYPQGPIIRVD